MRTPSRSLTRGPLSGGLRRLTGSPRGRGARLAGTTRSPQVGDAGKPIENAPALGPACPLEHRSRGIDASVTKDQGSDPYKLQGGFPSLKLRASSRS
jgi:hypothetical protein